MGIVMMHAANVDRSVRLRRLVDVLRSQPDGLTTRELIERTGSCAPHSDAAELRANGLEIDVRREQLAGRPVWRYRLHATEVA